MPIPSENSRIQYLGNGSTVNPYTVPFYFLANADVKVVLTDAAGLETLLTETTHYTLSGAGDVSGGELLTPSLAYPNTVTLTIYREPEQTQLSDLVGTGPLPASVITTGFDKLTMIVQSLSRKLGRCLRLTDSSDALDPIAGKNRASTLFGFASDGTSQLYDPVALLSLLNLGGSLVPSPTAGWTDDGERVAKVPDYVRQLGLQANNGSLWQSTGLAAGNWQLLAVNEGNMASNSTQRVPTQSSVKTYADTVAAAAQAASIAATLTPAGAVIDFAGNTPPAGWLLCYGQAVSRTTYAALFAAINTTYGIGDGSTTFNLPDCRGRVIAGKDNMGGSAANRLTNTGTGNPGIDGIVLGAVGGSEKHQLTVLQMPSHAHNYDRPTGPGSGLQSGTGASQPSVATTSAGGDQAHPNVQPTIVLNKIIKL